MRNIIRTSHEQRRRQSGSFDAQAGGGAAGAGGVCGGAGSLLRRESMPTLQQQLSAMSRDQPAAPRTPPIGKLYRQYSEVQGHHVGGGNVSVDGDAKSRQRLFAATRSATIAEVDDTVRTAGAAAGTPTKRHHRRAQFAQQSSRSRYSSERSFDAGPAISYVTVLFFIAIIVVCLAAVAIVAYFVKSKLRT